MTSQVTAAYLKELLGFDPEAGGSFDIFTCLDNNAEIRFNRLTHATEVVTQTQSDSPGEQESPDIWPHHSH